MSKIRVRLGDNEIELDGSDAFIAKQLEQFYQRLDTGRPQVSPSAIKRELLETHAKTKPGKQPTPAEFYKAKGKTDGISQVLIFGKYLEEFEGKSEFSPAEVNKVVEEAKLSKDIHSQYFANAVKQGLLRKRGTKYSLTLSAEEVLASM
jgi:hypothetical protein